MTILGSITGRGLTEPRKVVRDMPVGLLVVRPIGEPGTLVDRVGHGVGHLGMMGVPQGRRTEDKSYE